MQKSLSEMTMEELWELFPITLSEHKNCWGDWYEEEKRRIFGFLPVRGINIHHIGSTAIPTIWAKPIIDILLEIPKEASMQEVQKVLTGNGYLCMSEGKGRMSFNRGYTEQGFADRVFHLHLRYQGDNEELYFRDYMKENPVLAKEYERLKLSLWKEYEHDRDGYTEAKGAFVKKYTECAKKKYKNQETC